MKRMTLAFALCAFCSSLAASPKAYGTASGVAILMFHRFSPSSHSPYSISPTDFKKILLYLQKQQTFVLTKTTNFCTYKNNKSVWWI
ncbi:MAG: hypothetical protein ACK41E_05980 [Deinococcales bacterium]